MTLLPPRPPVHGTVHPTVHMPVHTPLRRTDAAEAAHAEVPHPAASAAAAEPDWRQAYGRVNTRAPAPDRPRDDEGDHTSRNTSRTTHRNTNNSADDTPTAPAAAALLAPWAAAPAWRAWPWPAPEVGPEVAPLGVSAAVPFTPPEAPPTPAAARAEPASPTAARMAEAARQVADPAPAAGAGPRSWEVMLPGAAPGWQLHIEQLQPHAPLALALQVPPVMAAHARHQLADLDRRLRDAGHDTLRSRLRQGHPERRHAVDDVDEVGP